MKLENRKQKVVGLPLFMVRMSKYAVFTLLLITISIGIGVVGYMTLGHTSFIDSFHMACMILTGMGPVVEMKTTGAKLFSSFYALYSGVAFLSITAVFFAPIIHRVLHIFAVDIDD
jgi:hypothetical protein